jgi:anti-sigma regulatory factor (Ser/Thr protein kinase)
MRGEGTTVRVDVRSRLTADASGAAEARSITCDTLETWGLPSLQAVACLLVTELVANVVRHAGWPSELTIRRRGDRVHIEVSDEDPSPPRRLHEMGLAASGRGLALVEDLSEDWGYNRAERGEGKVVWFELCSTTGR